MVPTRSFYFGNAVVDQVRDSGWFVGQFVPAELGLRHQNDVEVKWGIHPDGEKRRASPGMAGLPIGAPVIEEPAE